MVLTRISKLFDWRNDLYPPEMHALNRLCQSKWILVGLIVAGIVRSIVLLLAYPPGHGSDSMVYYLYAERMAGADFPELTRLVTPLYSGLILVAYKWLGSVYWLIGAQILMAVAIAPIYYLALRKISPILALLAGIVILGDVQTAIVANFIHTEPVYIFLLALLVYALMTAYELKDDPGSARPLLSRLALAGVLVGLLFLTRPVAKFLLVPVILVVWLVLRRGRPLAAVLGGFAGVVLVSGMVSLLAVGQVEGLTSGFYMAVRPTIVMERALEEEGVELDPPSACDDPGDNCLPDEPEQATPQQTPSTERPYEQNSVWPRVREILLDSHWRDYLVRITDDLLSFLALSAQQYGFDAELPSQVQCASVHEPQELTTEWLEARHYRWALPYDDTILATIRKFVPGWEAALCPPLPHDSAMRSLVDAVAERYRSLGRPRSQLVFWYAGPLLLALFLPFARRFVPLILTTVALVLYHALISAVALNVQPRYVVVINPLRTVVIVLMVYLLAALGGALVQRVRRSSQR